MSTEPNPFMQEGQAKSEFMRTATDLRGFFSRADSPQVLVAFDAVTEAALRFGACELRMRRAERLEALGLADSEVKHLKSTALGSNERGLAALEVIRPYLDELAASKSTREELALWQKSSRDLRVDWLEQVSEANVTAENARHLVRIMDECCDAVDKSGSAGLAKHLSATFAELEKQRRSPNRGTQEASFPWWKIVLAAAVLGIWVGVIYDLITNGAPWWNLYLVSLFMCIMMLVIALGC